MGATFFNSLNLILSLLGAVALIILALQLLTNSQTKLALGIKLRVRQSNGMQFSPISATFNGFINAATTGNPLRATSTLFSAIHAKMVGRDSASFMLLGIAQSHIIIVMIGWFVVWLAPSLTFAIALAGVGLVVSPLFKTDEARAFPRIIISFGLLIIGLNYFSMIANQCLSSLNLDLNSTELFLNYGSYAVVLGVLVGVIISIALRNIDAALLTILAISTSHLAPINLLFGAMIGASLGGVFFLAPIAESEGTVAKKIIIRHVIVIAIAIIISTITMPFILDIMYWLGLNKSVLLVAYLLHMLGVLWFSMFISRPIVKAIDNKVKDKEHREMRLEVLSSRIRPDSTISLILAHNETINHMRRSYKMMSFVRDMLNSDGDEIYVTEMNQRVEKYNKITKRVEAEVLSYVCAIALDDLSKINTLQMQRVIVTMNTVAQIASEVCELSELVLKGIIAPHSLGNSQKQTVLNIIQELQTLTYKAIGIKSQKPSDVKLEAFSDELNKHKIAIEEVLQSQSDCNNMILFEAIWQTKKINNLIAKFAPHADGKSDTKLT